MHSYRRFVVAFAVVAVVVVVVGIIVVSCFADVVDVFSLYRRSRAFNRFGCYSIRKRDSNQRHNAMCSATIIPYFARLCCYGRALRSALASDQLSKAVILVPRRRRPSELRSHSGLTRENVCVAFICFCISIFQSALPQRRVAFSASNGSKTELVLEVRTDVMFVEVQRDQWGETR